MSYKIKITERFHKDVKRLIKKYPSFKSELVQLRASLIGNPFQGIPIKYNCFKVRIAIAAKGKGKSGGGRLITHVHVKDETIFLLTIYDKSETENITDKELERLILELM